MDIWRSLSTLSRYARYRIHHRTRHTIYSSVRNAKRTAKAAVKCAVDMVKEELLKERSILRVEPKQIELLLHKSINPKSGKRALTRGLPARPGAATGQVVFVPKEAEEWKTAGKKIMPVSPRPPLKTLPGWSQRKEYRRSGRNDEPRRDRGRGIGKPAIVGCEALHIDLDKELFKVGEIIVKKGELITLDGLAGDIYVGEVNFIEPENRWRS